MDNNLEFTSTENKLCEYAKEGNLKGLTTLLTSEKIDPNSYDEDGMTPLQHAAYAGHYEICKNLLDKGADVNATYHRADYSALMFAGLAGKLDVVSLLLEHGASVTHKNTVNKTAAEMAAFVGNHDVVKLIQNFISLEEVEEIAVMFKGLKDLSPQIHKIAIMVNMHPVRLVLYIQENFYIFEKAREVCEVFNILSEKKFTHEENELLSLKFHHIAYILKTCLDFVVEKNFKATFKQTDTKQHNPKESISLLIKYWIKGDKKGFPVVLEKLLRQDVAEYPFKENTLFKDLIRTLGPVKIGDEPSAIWIISEITNEHRTIRKLTFCSTCGESCVTKKCSKCKSVYYCDAACQKLHWFTHKSICPELFEKYKEKETELSKEADTISN